MNAVSPIKSDNSAAPAAGAANDALKQVEATAAILYDADKKPAEQKAAEVAKTPEQVAAEKAEADKKTADAAAATKTPEQIAAEKAEADKAKTPEQLEADKKAAAEAAKQIDATKFKMAEGLQADPELLTELGAIAKELGVPQEGAQKFVDLGAKFAKKIEAKQVEAVQKAQQEWVQQSTTDKEFGGDALKSNLAVAKRAVDAYASPGLKELLGEYDPIKNPKGTGLGNHPEMIRAWLRVGKTISEDKIVTSGDDPNAAAGSKTPADVLYPNQGKS
jgi:hypothetical protein